MTAAVAPDEELEAGADEEVGPAELQAARAVTSSRAKGCFEGGGTITGPSTHVRKGAATTGVQRLIMLSAARFTLLSALLSSGAVACSSPAGGSTARASDPFAHATSQRALSLSADATSVVSSEAAPFPTSGLVSVIVDPASLAASPPEISSAPAKLYACNEQPPQEFLIRGNYVLGPDLTREEIAARKKMASKAVEYRTRRYGYVEGHGEPAWNHLTPHDYSKGAKFFGIGVKMNNRVLKALGCVEAAIVDDCQDTPYTPHLLDGLRTKNTFHNDEVSNHMYGIALDIDFDKNSCCGCVNGLSEWPRCKTPVDSPFERTTLPKCWVDSFTRFGFYWLGYDGLEDTMHFEFLGDPDKIVRKDP